MTTTQRTITHDGFIILKFPPRAGLQAGGRITRGTTLRTRDAMLTFPHDAVINAMVFTGTRVNDGQWVMYYTYLIPGQA